MVTIEPAAQVLSGHVPAVELVVALRNARDVIDRRFAEPLDLTALAAASGYSLNYFARSFRGAFGETPRGYLTRRRIERAQDLLRAANLTVTEICMLVGFSSLGSFSSRFTQVVGCSPRNIAGGRGRRTLRPSQAASSCSGCARRLTKGLIEQTRVLSKHGF